MKDLYRQKGPGTSKNMDWLWQDHYLLAGGRGRSGRLPHECTPGD